MGDSVQMRDFTKKRKAVQFKLDDDVYRCYPGLAPDNLQTLVQFADDVTMENALSKLDGFFELVMNEDNATRIKAKLRNKEEPLEIAEATEIMLWILEAYGLRPTQSSPDSSTGSPTGDDGTHSGDGA